MHTILKNSIKLVKHNGAHKSCYPASRKSNLRNLKCLVKYFSKIKNQGLIDDEKFKLLVVVVCQNFIENEIEANVNEKIINGINALFSSSQHATQ